MAFVNNFSTSFRWCDYIFGTDDKYHAYRKRVNAMRKAGLTPAQFAAEEKRLVAEAEAEGVRAAAAVEAYEFGKSKKD